jgi:DNA-binding CsgD family transcriptional regulator
LPKSSSLRRGDLSAALAFVREAGEAPDSGAFRQHVLRGLPRLVDSTITSYNDLSADGDPLLLLDPDDAWSPQRARDFLRLAPEHPLIAHYARTHDPRALKISDLMDRRSFRRTALYRDVYGPMGVEYQMAVTLPAPPGTVIGIALNRERRDFGERDRQMLDLLRPHLAQLRRDAALRDAHRLLSSLVDRALLDRGRAAIGVERGATIAFASAGARELVAAYLPAAGRPGDLPEDLAAWRRRERGRGLEPSRDLVVDGPRGRLVARLLSSPEPAGHDVILLEEREVGRERRALMALGLSSRQAVVLERVVLGRTNAQVAGDLHLSARTVQKHLENIYDRLGVRTRSAATARAVAAQESARR